jgi:hypothetical protein
MVDAIDSSLYFLNCILSVLLVFVRNIVTAYFMLFLYRCKTLSLTLNEEYRLRVFEIRVLRRIIALKRSERMGNQRKPHCEELHNIVLLI